MDINLTQQDVLIDNCQLEIDSDRGVIYVHSPLGHTALRLCGLATPIPDPSDYGRGLDITLKFQPLAKHTFSWRSNHEENQERNTNG